MVKPVDAASVVLSRLSFAVIVAVGPAGAATVTVATAVLLSAIPSLATTLIGAHAGVAPKPPCRYR